MCDSSSRDPPKRPPLSLPRHVAMTGTGKRPQRVSTYSGGCVRASSGSATESAPAMSAEKTSAKVSGVRVTHRLPERISRKQLRREIALAGIREDGEHALASPQFLSGNAGGVKYRARRHAAENTFQLCQAACSGARLFIADRHQSIDDVAIQNLRDEPGADSLDFVEARLASRDDRRLGRLHGIDFQSGNFPLEHLTGSCSGAAGTNAATKTVEASANHRNDFLSGRAP